MIKTIQVFGTGCPNCQKLYNLARQVVDEMGANITVEKIEDLNRIVEAGVFRTPGLGFDGKIVLQGKIPTAATLKNWILERQT